jgi:hypothetical protein
MLFFKKQIEKTRFLSNKIKETYRNRGREETLRWSKTWKERSGEGWFYKGRGKEDETVDWRIRGQFLMPVSLGIREKHGADFFFFY